jgi:DNA-binding GntR family transcriptional regulator
MQTVFEKLPSNTLRGRIAERIREAILDGSLPAGQRIVERRLAEQFGASLTAVREALIELESEGFIAKRPNSTTHVTQLSLGDACKILAVRRILEAYAVEEAARTATPEQIRQLETLYEQMVAAARAHDKKMFVQRDYMWHQALWQITDNEYLQTALRRVVLPFFAGVAIRIVSRDAEGVDMLKDCQLHVPILEAIRAKDPEGARKALTEALDAWIRETRDRVFGQADTSS